MAYKTIAVVLLVLAIVVEDASGCQQMRCYYPTEMQLKSRKMGVVKGATSGELRAVPSGPDPLHHNGASPNKPATP